MKTFWRRLVRAGLHHLYNNLAWAYDAVSWLVSWGEWRTWQRAAEPWMLDGRGLEIGCGRGDLLARQIIQGRRFCGLDLSPAMLRQTQRLARHQGVVVPLCQARAEQLPFAAESFATVVTTFPAEFVRRPATWREIYRVLGAGGTWVWVDGGRLIKPRLWARLSNLAFRLTTGDPTGFDPLLPALEQVGFTVRRDKVAVSARSQVWVLIAEKCAGAAAGG